MIRVLQLSAFYPEHGGGIEVVAGYLAKALAKERVEITWMGGLSERSQAPPEQPGLRILPARYLDPLERTTGLPCPVWGPQALGRLWRETRRSDMVHLHDYLYFPCLTAMFFARLQRKPVLVTQHIGALPLRSRVLRKLVAVLNHTVGRWMLRAADQVVFVSQPVMDFFSSFVRFKNPPLLIPNGLDHDLYRPAPDRAESQEIRLLFVGRFVEKKGIHHLRACLDLPGTRWTFVGWGPHSPKAWPELPDSATVVEHAAPAEIVPFYQQADLLVLPSVGEGFPLVVQEALACGTPVLVGNEVARACPRRDPGCVFEAEVSRPHAGARVRNALLVLTHDVSKLRAARPRAARLAGQWSWEACASSYRNAYHAMLQARRIE